MGPAADDRLWRAVMVRLVGLVAVSLVAATGPSVAAQTASQVLPPTREEVTRPEPRIQRNQALRLEVEGEFERTPCALDNPEFKDIRFTLAGARFEELRGLSPRDLAGTYEHLVGTQQPVSAVCEIRDRAAAVLRDAGYIAAVEVPEQRITDGVVRFRVVMARLVQTRVRGEVGGAERVIAGFLNKLTKQPVFNRKEAERYLLLASDLPGYVVRLTLRPTGEEAGEVFGDVTVQRTPAYASLAIQNGGSRQLGRWGGYGRAQFVGLTGLGDRTVVAAFTTSDLEEQRTVQVGHDFAIGAQGLRAGGFFTHGWAKPSVEGNSVLRARTLLATVQADYPFIRSVARTLRGSLGIDFVNQVVEIDSDRSSTDRLRTGFARLGFDSASAAFAPGSLLDRKHWRLAGSVELRKGLDILGAIDPCPPAGCGGRVPPSRLEGSPTAAIVRALLYGEYHPTPKLTLALAARGQYTAKPLMSFELFSAGNYTAGRGYDPGTLLGDRGWGTQAEIRYGRTTPASPRQAAVQGYLFFDHAQVGTAGDPLVPGKTHLNSVGGGARAAFERFAIDATLAVPLTRVGIPAARPDPRILISLTTRLWPWNYD